MKNLENKIAVVFAASGAIGSAVAKSFASKGAKVYVSARDLSAARMLADEIKHAGGWAEPHAVDAMNEAEINALLEKIIHVHGALDIVFNGIGIRPSTNGYGKPSTELSFKEFMAPIEAHVGSQFLTSRAAAKFMIKTKSAGTILTLTASLSRLKLPFMAGVTSACTAIEGLTRVLATEFGMFGIKVICINPTSLVETRTIAETTEANANSMGIPVPAFREMLAQQYILKKSPTLTDVGNMAAFLVSGDGALLNSHIVDVDFGSMSVI